MWRTLALFISLMLLAPTLSQSRASHPRPKRDNSVHFHYLYNYGYLKPGNVVVSENEVREALKRFQETFTLLQSGVADNDTLSLMNTPRCHEEDDVLKLRQKPPPTKRKFRVRVHGATSIFNSLLSRGEGRPFRSVFKLWSDDSNVVFLKAEKNSTADINVEFSSNHRMSPLDAVMATSSHDSLQVILNEEANFFLKPITNSSLHRKGSDMLRVLAHGIGHNLGFSHSFATDSVMYPLFPIVDNADREPLSLNEKDFEKLIGRYGRVSKNKQIASAGHRGEGLEEEEHDTVSFSRSTTNIPFHTFLIFAITLTLIKVYD